jgi:hypothetical protein
VGAFQENAVAGAQVLYAIVGLLAHNVSEYRTNQESNEEHLEKRNIVVLARIIGMELGRNRTCWRARGWRSCFFAKDPPNFIVEMLEILVTGLGLGSTIIALEHRHDSGQLSNWELVGQVDQNLRLRSSLI